MANNNLTNYTDSSINVRQYKHVITQDETIQQIAANYLGDVSLWKDIVKYNGLQYPYLVDTPEEKLNNVSHLMCLGDTIIIPSNTSLSDIDPNNLPVRDQETIEQLALGNDLAIDYTNSEFSNWGTYDGLADMQGNGKGDLALNRGSNNLKQAIIMRLSTRKGTLALHTGYGSTLSTMIGQPSSIYLEATKNSIQQCLETDSRVGSVTCNYFTALGNKVTSSWTVVPQGLETSWTFVLNANDTGNFTLTD